MAMDAQEFLQSLGNWTITFAENFPENYILPNLQLIIQVAALLILAYILGKIAKAVTVKLLSLAGLKKVTIRSWTDDILKAVGYRGTIVTLIGDIVKWFIYIMFLGLVIETLGFPGLLNIFTQIAIFLPRFIVAILLIVVGFLVADFFGKVFEEAGRRFFGDETIAVISGSVVKYTVALAAVIMALALVGLDPTALYLILGAMLAGIIVFIFLSTKDVLPDFTAGLHLRKVLRTGEMIKLNSYKGHVVRVDSLSTILKDGAKEVVVPNSVLIKGVFEKNGRKR